MASFSVCVGKSAMECRQKIPPRSNDAFTIIMTSPWSMCREFSSYNALDRVRISPSPMRYLNSDW